MCGIVGYIGPRQAPEVILGGLKRLEYRGYDSAGLAILKRNGSRQRPKKRHAVILRLQPHQVRVGVRPGLG